MTNVWVMTLFLKVIGQRIEGRSHQSSAELESESGSGGMQGSREQDS